MDQKQNNTKKIENIDNTSEIFVDSSEYDMIQEFLNFVRERIRGVFSAEIVTHEKHRYVRISITDQKKINLSLIKNEGDNNTNNTSR